MSHNPSAPTPQPLTASEEQGWGVGLHLGGFVAWLVAPLVIWLVLRERSRLIDQHGKAVVNWNITVGIFMVALFVLAVAALFTEIVLYFVVFGVMFILGLLIIIAGIFGAVAAYRGREFRYPLSIRFIS